MTINALHQMTSGECRYVGREDIHVYRHSPIGRDPKWCVVCPAAGMKHGNWTDLHTACQQIESILLKENNNAE